MFETILPMMPVPKQRPRSFIQRGRLITTTPPQTRQFEKRIKATVRAELLMAGHQVPLFPSGAVRMEVEAGPTRADADNVYKAIADAMNGILYKDDRQVEEMAVKVYRKAKHPTIRIRVDRVKTGRSDEK